MERPAAKLGTEDKTFGKRIGAFLIDTVALTAVGFLMLLVSFALSSSPDGMAIAVLGVQALMVVGMFAYFVVLEALYGQTLGKKLLGIVVVKKDGTDSDVVSSLIRNVLRIVDGLPFAYLLGMVAILLTDDKQRVGDLAGSTVVVETA